MQNIFSYEFLNFWPVGTSAIASETTKIAIIGGNTENKHLAQEAWFFFLIYRYTTLDFLAVLQFQMIYSF